MPAPSAAIIDSGHGRALSGLAGPTEAEDVTVACGLVNVPEDHGDPDGRRIDLTG
jgi:hypothetical protein